MGSAPFVVKTLKGDADLFKLHCLNPERYPFLLQTSAPNAVTGRFDILFAFPQAHLTLHGTELDAENVAITANDFLTAFDELHQASQPRTWQVDTDVTPLPFTGGWFVYLGYELSHEIEPSLPKMPKKYAQLPDACAVRIPVAVIFDHQTRRISVIAESDFSDSVQTVAHDWESIIKKTVTEKPTAPLAQVEEAANAPYLKGIEKIKHYIREGDVFQVNYSREWKLFDEAIDYKLLYPSMQKINPAPFSGLAKLGEFIIASMSPERLIKVSSSGDVETRPIAGTRPRGKNTDDDTALSDELLKHRKEQAEHIMLVDLERNDLGRVCEAGSIEVSEMMGLESYATVHHIVSNIHGKLRQGMTPGQVIRAVFPGGTITGCPKVRCMEIISELEQEARQAYTGSMGYINHDGSMDFNILIRTLLIHGEQISFRTGAGIVFDSIAANELEETRAKAQGMLNVLGRHESL